ncbi:MAG: rRNA maturation RNase YbeY [Deltaproteobacteria bacterium]|nr:rRNA maturation RNase YbeY [Deltaproteobacteria bacterium]MBW2360392.1 rRNA maturation RNase YbeY [Deltaproteobacteria bacterium]
MTLRLVGPPRGGGLPAIDTGRLRTRARGILRALGHARSELSVALVDDAEMRELNGVWRGKPRATDVLAFSMLEGEGAEHRGRLLGDVVISVETARRQARARHRALDEEVTRLLIHGTLHLLGFDHVRAADARAMRTEERRLFSAVRDDG